MKTALTLLAILIATPTLARERCDTPEPGLTITYGFGIGGGYDEEEQEIFDKMELRKRGVVARETKRTSDGCIEAWVPNGQGGFDTEYYDEDTFELKLD